MEITQLFDPFVELPNSGVEQIGDMSAWRLALVSDLQDLVQFAEGPGTGLRPFCPDAGLDWTKEGSVGVVARLVHLGKV